ncbi:MAG TPA: class I SAM-dependent methyltransferase [Thermoanaerobaculia bacterium]|nr:class I SAM-dependent methyltransferase [Thermoanaerobaculia bacterium]
MQESGLPTRQSLNFIGPLLPGPGARLLEVGCGDGRLARDLVRLGFAVVGVDRDPAAVQAARTRGVEALEADFLDFTAAPFDVILFTRSLHHIHPVEAALDRAARLLRSPGLIIADEFAWDRIDFPTARWLYDLRRILEAGGILAPEAASVSHEPLERWLEHHRHTPPLASGDAMLHAAGERFELLSEAPAPYLYRYFHHWLAPRPSADPVCGAVLAMEAALIEHGALAAVGLQFAARQ